MGKRGPQKVYEDERYVPVRLPNAFIDEMDEIAYRRKMSRSAVLRDRLLRSQQGGDDDLRVSARPAHESPHGHYRTEEVEIPRESVVKILTKLRDLTREDLERPGLSDWSSGYTEGLIQAYQHGIALLTDTETQSVYYPPLPVSWHTPR